MKEWDHDMERLVANLRSRRCQKNIDRKKLALLLKHAELNVPGSWLAKTMDVSRLRGSAAPISRLKRLSMGSMPKTVRWVLVPAFAAAAAVLIMIAIQPLLFRGDRHSGRVLSVSGDAWVLRGGGRRALDADATVARGDVILTGRSTSVDIGFSGEVLMRVLGGSRVSLGNPSLNDAGGAFDALVTGGACMVKVSKLAKGESLSFRTSASAASVRGTVFGVRVYGDRTVRYEVFEGRVRVRRCLTPDQTVALRPEVAALLNRHFEEHAVEVAERQTCRINPDVKPPAAAAEDFRELTSGISLPVVSAGPDSVLQMLDEAERFMTAAEQRVEKSDARPEHLAKIRRDARRDAETRREAAHETAAVRGKTYLMYVPEMDGIIQIGGRRVAAIRSRETLWTIDLDGPIASLPVREAMSLFVATAPGTVSRIDLFTGKTLWSRRGIGAMNAKGRPVLDKTGVYCVTAAGAVYKLGRNGSLMWRNSIGGGVSATPVIARQLIFITAGGSLYGIDTTRGVKMIKVGFGSGITSLCAQQNRIFIATDAGKIICYDFKDDEVLWEYAVYDTVAGDMAVENDSIYLFGRKGRVHRISSSGVLIWSRDLGNPIMKLPSEDSASYYIPSDETLFVIDKVTGTITWALLMPRITSGNVAVSHGAIYFGTEKDGLSSLKK